MRPENKFRFIRFNQTFQLVCGERRIDECDRVAGRGRGEKADHCSAVVAAKNENEPLSVRSDLFCETKAGRPNFFARQPVFAAVVAKRRPSLLRLRPLTMADCWKVCCVIYLARPELALDR